MSEEQIASIKMKMDKIRRKCTGVTVGEDIFVSLNKNTNMEKTMYTPEENKVRTLTSWMYEIYNSKAETLREKFNLNQIKPKTDEEVVEFIQKGQFTLEEHDDAWCGRKVKKLVWVDPNRAPDKAGYEAAKKVLDKDYTTTTRIIQIKTPDEGLTALTEFENKVY